MKTIELHIQDNKDLLILWNCLNFMQDVSRKNLAQNNTNNKDIERDWLRESLDEWDRMMTLKAQIEKVLIDERQAPGGAK